VHVGELIAESGSAVPVVKYEIRSMRNEGTRVTITDDVPGHLTLDDVGFHEEHWTHTDRFSVSLRCG
jgi:hypothetical protein